MSLSEFIMFLIETDELQLLDLLSDWLQYNNKNCTLAIELILDNSDILSDDFFEKFIVLLDKYNHTEYALLVIRDIINRQKNKDRFTL